MDSRLHSGIGQFLKQWPRRLWLGPGLALIVATGGCAAGRPSPLLVEHRLATVPEIDCDQGIKLKLVTYNIWGLPSWMTGARHGRYSKIAHELERIEPDVILLQEAWTANARKSAPANSVWSTARASGQDTFFRQSGLVTLSRFPITGGIFHPFSRAAFPDNFVNKGVLKVTVQLPGGRVLNVWNVHLQDGGSTALHSLQIRELLSWVQAAEDDQIADVIGGDFNCTPGSSLYCELANCLGPSVQQWSGAKPFVTWDGLSSKPGAGQTLDYVFVRTRVPFQSLAAVPRVAFAAPNLEERLSDHFGIEAEVNLSAGSSLAGAIRPTPESARLSAVSTVPPQP